MNAKTDHATGEVSCRTTGYTIQHIQKMGLPTDHLTAGMTYSLKELLNDTASIPWDDYLIFFRNSHNHLAPDQFVDLCSSYKGSPHFRPILSAAG